MTTDIPALTSALIASVFYECEANDPGILVRGRLEWTWGLPSGTLEDHLRSFVDPAFMQILLDDSLIIVPQDDIVKQIREWSRNPTIGIPRPHIQELYEGCQSFEYMILPVDPSAPVPPSFLSSEVPPHLTISTTCTKLERRWRDLIGRDFDATLRSLIRLAQTCTPTESTSIPSFGTFTSMQSIYRKWVHVYVPRSFLGLEEEEPLPAPETRQQMDKPKEGGDSASSAESETDSFGSSCGSPQRRLLSCEGGAHDPDNEGKMRFFSSADGRAADDDTALSFDSHISGVDDPEDWAEGTAGSGSPEESLLNDSQIVEDPTELPRIASALDLTKPDYERLLSKKRRKTRNST
ncbi:hypothetical protein C8J57DRAFT_1506383 [Mycena rebaudengoi]|nr:hypothetical protein C8J57DRAFT_1506383 [Mycena rebaudengoi]